MLSGIVLTGFAGSLWLTRQYQAEWRRAGRLVYQRVVRLCQRLPILVEAHLMLCNLVSEARDDCSVEPLPLSVSLEAIGSRRQVHSSQTSSHVCEELRDKIAVCYQSVGTSVYRTG